MKAFRTIKSYNSCFGEYEYRATSNGSIVHIQERSPKSKSWRIIYRMPAKEFYRIAEVLGLYSNNKDNPAGLLQVIHYNDQLFSSEADF